MHGVLSSSPVLRKGAAQCLPCPLKTEVCLKPFQVLPGNGFHGIAIHFLLETLIIPIYTWSVCVK